MKSVWEQTGEHRDFAPLKGDISTDVLIIGGGMAGILLGVWIFTKISKEHKIELWTAYVLALGLMYAVSKLGCFFAGCCVGMKYQGPGSIRYLDNGAVGEYLFPVQLAETILFLLAFCW